MFNWKYTVLFAGISLVVSIAAVLVGYTFYMPKFRTLLSAQETSYRQQLETMDKFNKERDEKLLKLEMAYQEEVQRLSVEFNKKFDELKKNKVVHENVLVKKPLGELKTKLDEEFAF